MKLGIGDLVVGQKVELVLRVRFPQVAEGAQTTAFFTIADRDGVLKADGCTLTWEHASHAANDDQPRDRDVDRAVARIHAARARLEAVQLNRQGEYDHARQALRGVARRIGEYAGDDAALNDLAGSLVAEEYRHGGADDGDRAARAPTSRRRTSSARATSRARPGAEVDWLLDAILDGCVAVVLLIVAIAMFAIGAAGLLGFFS